MTNVQSYAKAVVEIGGTLSNAVFQSVRSLGSGAPLSVWSGAETQKVVFCEVPSASLQAASGGTPSNLEDAVLELDVRADGTCDRFEAKGDLVLTGLCRVVPLIDPAELRAVAKKRYEIGTWAGTCTGTLTLDEEYVNTWRLVKNEGNRCFRLVPFDGAVVILR